MHWSGPNREFVDVEKRMPRSWCVCRPFVTSLMSFRTTTGTYGVMERAKPFEGWNCPGPLHVHLGAPSPRTQSSRSTALNARLGYRRTTIGLAPWSRAVAPAVLAEPGQRCPTATLGLPDMTRRKSPRCLLRRGRETNLQSEVAKQGLSQRHSQMGRASASSSPRQKPLIE
jgi:hypothetical protein